MAEKTFQLELTNDRIWNLVEFISFLVSHQDGSIHLRINPEAACLSHNGVYSILDCFKFQSVRITTANKFEHSDKYQINHDLEYIWLDHSPAIDDADVGDPWYIGGRRFLMFYRRPTAARLCLAAYAWSHHSQHSLIHFNCGTGSEDLFKFEFDKAALYRSSSIKEISELLPHMPIYAPDLAQPRIEDTNQLAALNYRTLPINSQIYQDVFLDIVCEGHVHGDTFYPSEKTSRPIWMLRPFLTFASKNFLAHLRQMGFRTFHDFWCEDYDAYDGGQRLEKIIAVMDRLAALSPNDILDMYHAMKPVLRHNRQVLANNAYSVNGLKQLR